MIKHKKEWGFVHIPKNAGTSVRRAYSKKYGGSRGWGYRTIAKEGKHWPYSAWLELEEVETVHFICRNPWDRALSIYLWELSWAGQVPLPDYHAILVKQGFKGAWMGELFKKERPGDPWRYSHPQVRWAEGCDQAVWWKQEYNMFELGVRLGLDIGRDNATYHANYRAYYDDELADYIGELFKKDVERFGYEF